MKPDEAEWHDMLCGICGETWWLPYGEHPYALVVVDLAAEHSRGHRLRGEVPAYNELLARLALARGAS